MTSTELRVGWCAPDPYRGNFKPGSWGIVLTPDEPANQLGRHLIEHNYDLDAIDRTLRLIEDLIAGRHRPGWVGGDNTGAVAYGTGHFYIASDYIEHDQVVVTAGMFRRAFEWLRDLRTHRDFTNPDGCFEPLVVEVVANGPGSAETYLELGGSVFIESSPNTDHQN